MWLPVNHSDNVASYSQWLAKEEKKYKNLREKKEASYPVWGLNSTILSSNTVPYRLGQPQWQVAVISY